MPLGMLPGGVAQELELPDWYDDLEEVYRRGKLWLPQPLFAAESHEMVTEAQKTFVPELRIKLL